LILIGSRKLVFKVSYFAGFPCVNQRVAAGASRTLESITSGAWKPAESRLPSYHDRWRVVVSPTLRSSANMV
jgi:hypothetical protein